MRLGKVRVELHPDCVKFGGREEYPDRHTGIEVVPEAIWNNSSGETAEERHAMAKRLYEASAPYTRESLRLVAFPEPFVGKTPNGSPQVKTRSEGGRHVMWIPATLVRPLIEEARANALAA